MKIYFLRHAEAEEKKEGMSDKDRPLTSKGVAAISNIAKDFKRSTGGFDLILTSPFLRARQTADIIGNILNNKGKISESQNLIVGAPPSALLDELKKHAPLKRLLLVGHQPHLGMCVSFLTGGGRDIDIGKGDCALVETEDLKEGAAKIAWIKRPDDIK